MSQATDVQTSSPQMTVTLSPVAIGVRSLALSAQAPTSGTSVSEPLDTTEPNPLPHRESPTSSIVPTPCGVTTASANTGEPSTTTSIARKRCVLAFTFSKVTQNGAAIVGTIFLFLFWIYNKKSLDYAKQSLELDIWTAEMEYLDRCASSKNATSITACPIKHPPISEPQAKREVPTTPSGIGIGNITEERVIVKFILVTLVTTWPLFAILVRRPPSAYGKPELPKVWKVFCTFIIALFSYVMFLEALFSKTIQHHVSTLPTAKMSDIDNSVSYIFYLEYICMIFILIFKFPLIHALLGVWSPKWRQPRTVRWADQPSKKWLKVLDEEALYTSIDRLVPAPRQLKRRVKPANRAGISDQKLI